MEGLEGKTKGELFREWVFNHYGWASIIAFFLTLLLGYLLGKGI